MSHDVFEPAADRVLGVPELPDMPEFVDEGPGFRGYGAEIRALFFWSSAGYRHR